jgi:anaerobic dimethyl sulfoxide reductase subunit A
MTPTAKFADILLPVNTAFEREDIFIQWPGGEDFYYGHKVIDSLHESKTDLEIFTELANRLGFGRQFNDKTEVEWLREFVRESEIPDFDAFRREGVHKPPKRDPFVCFRNQIEDPENNPFNTPSGKIEIYSKRLEDMNQPETIPALPKYIEPWEGRKDPLFEKYPLQLITPHPKASAHSVLFTNAWLRDLEPHQAWINAEDGSARGIRSGDKVRVFNDRGTVVITAKLTERIMPGVVSISEGAWYHPDKEGRDWGGCANVLTKDECTLGLYSEFTEGVFVGLPTKGFGFTTNTSLVQIEKL